MLEGFCEYLRRQGKSENTVKAYCQGMKEYMRWHEETFGKRMKLFLRANVLDYISYLRTVKGLSNRSVNAKLASLHSFNLYLIAAGYTKEVVLDKQDYLKVQLAYASPSTVSREEVERFRQEIAAASGTMQSSPSWPTPDCGSASAWRSGWRTYPCRPGRSRCGMARGTRCGWCTSGIRWSTRCGSTSGTGRRREIPICSPGGATAT